MYLHSIFRYDNLETHDKLIEKNMLLKGAAKEGFEYPFVDTNTYVGVEVEVEGILTQNNQVRLSDEVYLWRNVEDNSLRNNGREFVSVPVRGKHIKYALSRLHTILTRSKTCIGHSFTPRTSVHVHMNVRDFTTEELRNLIVIYSLVEPLLYSFADRERYNNIFCVPMKETDINVFRHKIFDTTQPIFNDFVTQITRHWSKYSSLNLLPISTYGTVEFRHMSGTCDVEKLCNWINIILCIKKYAKAVNFDELLLTINTLNSTSEYSGFLRAVFGDFAKLFDGIDINKIVDDTVSNVKLWTHHSEAMSVLQCLPKDKNSVLAMALTKIGCIRNKKGDDSNGEKIKASTVQNGVADRQVFEAWVANVQAREVRIHNVQVPPDPRGR